jgi:UDP-3-O-[3-hydroxymyristoyl] glucosamine N-acyltransferase
LVTFSELTDHLDGAHRKNDASVRALDEPGHGSDGVAEVWFDGPVDSSAPVVVDGAVEVEAAPAVLRVDELSDQLSELLAFFDGSEDREWGISAEASVADDFTSDGRVYVGPNAVVGSDVVVGEDVRIGPGVHIVGPARLGDHVQLYSGVKLVSPVEIGNRTVIHSNTVIGSDGYGYEQTGEDHEKIPQVGRVIIHEDVEIGASAAVDRATYGRTVIGAGSKLDNHVHVAHNCKIGENCLLVAKSGLAGSVTLGDNVILAGMAAVEDHNTLADGVIVAAKAGVTKDIDEEGAVVSGFPARAHDEQLKIQALSRKLPQFRKDLMELKKEFNRKGDPSREG